jgi:chromosome partitioning protein
MAYEHFVRCCKMVAQATYLGRPVLFSNQAIPLLIDICGWAVLCCAPPDPAMAAGVTPAAPGPEGRQTAMIISIAHHAGGVGKTTTTLNLGYALAEKGRRVLLVDLDPQADLSERLHLSPEEPTLAHVLGTGQGEVKPVRCAWNGVEVDVVPSTLDMAGAELALAGVINGRERRLSRALKPLSRAYDVILVDCPPSLSLLTSNAFYAAERVIIPVQAHDKAYRAIPLVLGTIGDVAEYNNDLPGVLGFVVTLTGHTRIEEEVAQAVADDYPDLAFRTTIPRLIEYAEDSRWGKPIGAYRPSGKGAAAYRELAAEVLGRIDGRAEGNLAHSQDSTHA